MDLEYPLTCYDILIIDLTRSYSAKGHHSARSRRNRLTPTVRERFIA
ncbi:hypothetical protein ABIE62_001056 [Porphyrobacter sp. MBR-155]|jgi:hypothetical protein